MISLIYIALLLKKLQRDFKRKKTADENNTGGQKLKKNMC